MTSIIKKNKKNILISDLIFFGINNNIFCGYLGGNKTPDSGNNTTETPKSSLTNGGKRIDTGEDKDNDKDKENKDKGKDLNGKPKDEVLNSYSDDYLQGIDEKYFLNSKTYKYISTYIQECLKLKPKEEEIQSFEKKLDDLKKIEKEIIKKIKEFCEIPERKIEKNTTVKHLYYIYKYQISNINIKPEVLFDDEDNKCNIYKKYKLNFDEVNVLKTKYNSDETFKNEFDETIEKAKEDYKNIETLIDNDKELEKFYINPKHEADKIILSFTDINPSLSEKKGSEGDYRHLFKSLLNKIQAYLLNNNTYGIKLSNSIHKALFKDNNFVGTTYNDLHEDLKTEIKSKNLEDIVKNYIDVIVFIDENIKKLNDNYSSIDRLLQDRDRIVKNINKYKNDIDDMIKLIK